jgi:hypothetical protein
MLITQLKFRNHKKFNFRNTSPDSNPYDHDETQKMIKEILPPHIIEYSEKLRQEREDIEQHLKIYVGVLQKSGIPKSTIDSLYSLINDLAVNTGKTGELKKLIELNVVIDHQEDEDSLN